MIQSMGVHGWRDKHRYGNNYQGRHVAGSDKRVFPTTEPENIYICLVHMAHLKFL